MLLRVVQEQDVDTVDIHSGERVVNAAQDAVAGKVPHPSVRGGHLEALIGAHTNTVFLVTWSSL
jgi:hypothetical protein